VPGFPRIPSHLWRPAVARRLDRRGRVTRWSFLGDADSGRVAEARQSSSDPGDWAW